MWIIPSVEQRLKISDKFWDAWLKDGRSDVVDWYKECVRDGGWILKSIEPASSLLGWSAIGPNGQIILQFSPTRKFQVVAATGALFSFTKGPPIFEVSYEAQHITDNCPICGSPGMVMVNRFYCTHNTCQNYVPE